MRKLLVITAFILLAGVAYGQTLQKGSILALHVISVNLDPDVTYNQWKNFGLTKFIPEFNKQFQGDVKLYFAEVDRGDDENGISLIYIFKSVEVRAKYFTEEGDATELFNSRYEKVMQAFPDEISALGTTSFSYEHYNDWVIQ
jgi:hypothetical protein